jgi:hypothetical protein
MFQRYARVTMGGSISGCEHGGEVLRQLRVHRNVDPGISQLRLAASIVSVIYFNPRNLNTHGSHSEIIKKSSGIG